MHLPWGLHTKSDFVAFTEASTKRRMPVVNTSIDDTDLDTPPSDTCGVDFIDTSHGMRSVDVQLASNIGKRAVCSGFFGCSFREITWQSY